MDLNPGISVENMKCELHATGSAILQRRNAVRARIKGEREIILASIKKNTFE